MGKKSILYVDDDADLRRVVKEQLVSTGYDVMEAEDGNQAVEQLDGGKFDLMILDINMPGKSGLEVLKFVREKGLSCRTIMLTGRVGFLVATQSLKLGADEYITKPFNLDYLLATIARVLAE